ncbi:Adenylate cyclase type 10, partial [Dinochytrium kinnereticum]
LQLQSNLFSGEIPSSLSDLRNLRTLNLRGNCFSGGVPPAVPGTITFDPQREDCSATSATQPPILTSATTASASTDITTSQLLSSTTSLATITLSNGSTVIITSLIPIQPPSGVTTLFTETLNIISQPSQSASSSSNGNLPVILGVSIPGVLGVIGALVAAVMVTRKRRRRMDGKGGGGSEGGRVTESRVGDVDSLEPDAVVPVQQQQPPLSPVIGNIDPPTQVSMLLTSSSETKKATPTNLFPTLPEKNQMLAGPLTENPDPTFQKNTQQHVYEKVQLQPPSRVQSLRVDAPRLSGSVEGWADPRNWGVDQVVDWLRLGGFSSGVVEVFRDHQVDGARLFSLSEDRMREELGIEAIGVRVSLRAVIERLCVGETMGGGSGLPAYADACRGKNCAAVEGSVSVAGGEEDGLTEKVLRIPSLVECVGVVAILDLSGYTSLSELLFKGSDNAGGERLFKTVNPFFGAMIDTLHEYGGDIIKFCGDSIIVCWTQRNSDRVPTFSISPALVQRTLFCVAEVVKRYDGYRVRLPAVGKESRNSPNSGMESGPTEEYGMGVHIGLGVGSFGHLIVGERKNRRSEYLLVGKAIAEASFMLQKTKRGEMALSLRAWDTFRTGSECGVEGEKLGQVDDTPVIVISKTSKDFEYISMRRDFERGAMKADVCCPEVVLYRNIEDFLDESAVFRVSRLVEENTSPDLLHYRLSELRRVTTVFLQIHDFTANMGPSETVAFVQRLFEVVHKPLVDYKGRLRQIVFDDKGLTVLMVWGLPPSNSVDHVLALFCAIAIRDSIKDAAIGRVSIGVSSGPTFTGVIGNAVRSDFNLFGRSINIAARCMSMPQCQGSILCDLLSIESKDIQLGGFEFSDRTIVSLKGINGPLDVAILQKGNKDPLRIGFGMIPAGLGQSVDLRRSHDGSLQSGPVRDGWKRPGIVGRDEQVRAVEGKVDCFEIARHAEFYVLKLLLLQSLEQLLKLKSTIITARKKIEAFLEQEFLQKPTANERGMKKTSSLASANSHGQNSHPYPESPSLHHDRKSAASLSTHQSGWSMTQLPSAFENDVSDVLELLEVLGFSSKLIGSAAFKGMLGFLGIQSSYGEVGVRSILLRLGRVVTECLGFRMVFMVDNCQWCDLRSLTEVTHFMNSNLDALIFLQSRPIDEIKEDAMLFDYNFMMKLPNMLQIDLNLMDFTGTQQLIANVLGCRVHTSLVEEIHRNSGGVPMVIEILTMGLKAPGVLRLVDGVAWLEDGVKISADEKNAGSLISSQFDQLSLKFQLLLKVASISGISFSLEHVTNVCNDLSDAGLPSNVSSAFTIEEAAVMIQKEDAFDFLQHASDIEDTNSFRHIYIQRGVQSLVLTDLRKRVHFQLFLYLDLGVRESESILRIIAPQSPKILQTSNKITFGVPLLEAYFHLEESGDLLEERLSGVKEVSNPYIAAKKVRLDYLLRTATFYYDRHIYGEALMSLQKLFQAWDAISETSGRHGESEMELLPDDLTRARFYALLSYVYRAISMAEESYHTSAKGLRYVGVVVPSSVGKFFGFCLKAMNETIRYNGQMRRYLRKMRRRNQKLIISVDHSFNDSRNDLTHELFSLMLSVGLFVEQNMLTFAVGLKGMAHGKNVFRCIFNQRNAEGYLMGDQFRCMLGGAHTAASIALVVIYFAEECLNSDAYSSSEIREIIQNNDHGPKKTLAESKTEAKGIPVIFNVTGQPPLFFSFEMAQLLQLISVDSRLRDLLELQAKYLRLASIVLRELKLEASFMCQSVWVYYREVMHFCCEERLTYEYLNPVINGDVDVRTFKQYAWAEAIHYSCDSMDLETAEVREREYMHMTGNKGFSMVLEGEDQVFTDATIPAIRSGIREASCKPLPAMLERDSHINFLHYRVTKVFVAVEKAFEKISEALNQQGSDALLVTAIYDFRKSMDLVRRKQGLELENVAKILDGLMKEPLAFFPSLRFMLLFRVITAWRVLSLCTRLRSKWISYKISVNAVESTEALQTESIVDPWSLQTAAFLCRKWTFTSIKTCITTNKSVLSPFLRPMFEGAVELAKDSFSRALRPWSHSLKILDDMEDGKEVPSQDRAGEFIEPAAWRGIRFLTYQREIIMQRSVLVEALDCISILLKQIPERSKKRAAKVNRVGPVEFKLTDADKKRLRGFESSGINTVNRLKTFKGFASFDIAIVNAMLGLLKDILL